MKGQSASDVHTKAQAATRRRARLLGWMAAVSLVLLLTAQGGLAQQDPLPPPPLPVDSTPINDLLSAAERAMVADAEGNGKKLIETYIKIAESHLSSALTLTKNENGRVAVDELNIYNKAIAEAGKHTFGQQDGRRKLSKKLEQVLYKHIKMLESIEREISVERHTFAEDALKRTKQLRVQALNEAFAGGDILKDPDETDKKSTPPGKGGPPNNNELIESLTPQHNLSLQLASYHPDGFRDLLGQMSGDYLTEEEDEQVRVAQETDKRAKVFMKIADRRLAAITGETTQAAAGDKKRKRRPKKKRARGGRFQSSVASNCFAITPAQSKSAW